ncbi:C6 zinc finger domain protein [Diplocarpon rosae]|nr:C6 zinc finger domain protein [Diplocarpon rosae]
MPSEFISKRPHKKSRGGCGTYSQLSTPLHNTAVPGLEEKVEDIHRYDWDLTTSPSSPAINSSIGILSPTDLRYMHHWSTSTWNSVAVGNWADGVLRMAVPSLALDHDFLLNTMLGIASLHSQHLLPDPRQAQIQTGIYRARALKGLRNALTDITCGTRKYEAGLITSLMVTILCSGDGTVDEGELIIVQWLILYRGLNSIILLRDYDALNNLSVSPIFRREIEPLKTAPIIPQILVDMLREISPLDPDFELLEYLRQALDALGSLFGQLREDGLGPALSIRVITYPSFCPKEFALAAKNRRPRALVILAYYMIFTKLVKDLWWVEGIAEREFGTLLGMLGPEWLSYVEVPIQAMTARNDYDVIELMLK